MKNAHAVALDLQTCSNCGFAVSKHYCAHCGQRQRTPSDLQLSRFFRHAIAEITSFDSKIFRSLGTLLIRPGTLTNEWSAGRERSYVKPLQLFLLINVGYFIFVHFIPVSTLVNPLEVQYSMQPYSMKMRPYIDRKIRESKLPYKEFAARYDEASAEQSKGLVILMAPLFASLVAVLTFRRRRYVVEHLIFSLHFYAFFLIVCSIGVLGIDLIVYGIAQVLGYRAKDLDWEAWSTYVPAAILFGYLLLSLRKVYNVTWIGGAVRSILLTYSLLLILWAYRFILLFITLNTMRVNH